MVCSHRFSRSGRTMRRIYRSVQPSNTVQSFDPLCEVQSDKASVEITSPFDGVIKEILVKEGDVAKVGEGLCVIEIEDSEEQPEASSETAPSSPLTQLEQEAVNSQGPIPQSQRPEASRQRSSPTRKPHPLDPNVPPEFKATSGSNTVDVLATPSVRHFARQKGVDLASLAPGSGKGGRVERKDVEAYLASPTPTPAPPSTHSDTGFDVVVELGRTRYGMWKAMTKVSIQFVSISYATETFFILQSLEIPHFGSVLYNNAESNLS